MRKKGVDTAQIDPIEAQRAAVEKDLQMVKNVTELVQQYRHQLRKRRPMHLKWLAESQQSSVIAPEAYAAYGQSGAQWDQRREQIAAATKDAGQGFKSLTK
jgi:hypothetical protein